MSDLAEMRKQLRELRKESVKPVSRMKKADISAEIERMKKMREETPAPAATPSTKPKKMNPSVSTIKEAKAAEFPVAPTKESKKLGKAIKEAGPPKTDALVAKKKESKKERIMKIMAEESSDEE